MLKGRQLIWHLRNSNFLPHQFWKDNILSKLTGTRLSLPHVSTSQVILSMAQLPFAVVTQTAADEQGFVLRVWTLQGSSCITSMHLLTTLDMKAANWQNWGRQPETATFSNQRHEDNQNCRILRNKKAHTKPKETPPHIPKTKQNHHHNPQAPWNWLTRAKRSLYTKFLTG